MHDGPLVSVVVPTFGRPALLARAVESVRRQSYGRWELVVSDDEAGGGETWDYLQCLAERDPRVRPVRHEGPGGQVANTNHALRHARGEWIKLLHDDDVLKPLALERLLGAVRRWGGPYRLACVTCSAERYVRDELLVSRRRASWPRVEIIPRRAIPVVMYMAEDAGGAAPSQKMIHRRVLDRGVFMEQPPGLRMLVDSWFNARVGTCGDLMLLREPLVEWHQGDHPSVTGHWGEEVESELYQLRDMLWEMVEDREELPPPEVMKQMVALQRGLWRMRHGQLRRGLDVLRRVRGGRAVLEYARWVGHNVSKGRLARGTRIRPEAQPEPVGEDGPKPPTDQSRMDRRVAL